jgi:NADPH-dependent 2,4-dienoyl-CoA reductase/sulfur reductase-like enzyme/nitrite reductase/ring-hydroxylating ferredoxin subunit
VEKPSWRVSMNYKEAVVAKITDLKDGQMKRVPAENTEVLLSRINGEFYAVGAFCPHYGAPLDLGVLSGERVVCPWHHACFNAKTGDLLEPPSRDSLPHYEVKIDGEDLIVRIPQKTSDRELPKMVKFDLSSDRRTFVIIGAGAAGNAAAQALREDGFKGKVIMITYENRLPYDRPNLSKDYLQGKAHEDWMPLRAQDFYDEYGIELIRGRRVEQADIRKKMVLLHNGDTLNYDKLLLTTGGRAIDLEVPGNKLKNIFTLRTYDDAERIIRACESSSRAAIIGASFIGMETAYSLRKRGGEVSVIAPESVPFEHVFGREIGKLFHKLHEDNGVRFKLGRSVSKFEGKDKVESVVLDDGEIAEADLVVVGIGVKPATDIIRGMDLMKDGSIKVDKYLCAAEDVYAAGDIASFPDWRTGELTRIEHWRTAEQHGRIAARNMAGHEIPYESVPFFWTMQVGLNFRYVGYVKDWDDLIIDGDLSSKRFIAYYVRNNQVLAVAGNKRDKEMAAIEELMRKGKMPAPDELRRSNIKPLDLLDD